jgi:hypothetical protein
VHLHKQYKNMQGKEDLGCPSPSPYEWPAYPIQQPSRLKDALNGHSNAMPSEQRRVQEQQLKCEAQIGTGSHKKVAEGQFPYILCEERPLTDKQRKACLLEIAEHGSDDHDGQSNPE